MSRITAPLLSFGASGAIAKTQVYSKWKGLPYVRQYVIPANPRSTEQTLTRSVFAWLQSVWKFAPSQVTEVFEAYASGQAMTDRNAFSKANISPLRAGITIDDFVFSPGAKSGLAASAVVAADGVGQSVVTITAPVLPTGWAIVEGIAAGIKAQNPHTDALYAIHSAIDAATPFTPTITGLSAGTWRIGGWFKFTKPDGSFAYGPSISDTAVIT